MSALLITLGVVWVLGGFGGLVLASTIIGQIGGLLAILIGAASIIGGILNEALRRVRDELVGLRADLQAMRKPAPPTLTTPAQPVKKQPG